MVVGVGRQSGAAYGGGDIVRGCKAGFSAGAVGAVEITLTLLGRPKK